VAGVNDDGADHQAPNVRDAGEYCRLVEVYLCRKNEGHLVRIAGPSFARVCGWAERGIPLNVVHRGIDRYFERYYSRGPRRRPVHIDFCEHDVLDVFDEWRRAVGVQAWGGRREAEGEGRAVAELGALEADPAEAAFRRERRASLPAHLERVIVRLTTLRAGGRLGPEADAAVDSAVRELDAARGRAAHLRGDARDAIVGRLRDLDLALVAAVRASIDDQEWHAIEREAQAELAPFKGGMTAEAHQRAVAASATRLLRERALLPAIAYDE
jgi:hypothetical protein